MIMLVETFQHRFRHWEISLPESDVERRAPGLIRKEGWTITYHFGSEAGREYVEFFACHRMTDDTLNRIYDDGSSEIVDVCQKVVDLSDPDWEEKLSAQNHAFYARVRELGLC